MTQPVLHSARLELRPLCDHHLDLLVELDSDPQVLRYIASRARTRAEVEASLPRRLAYADAPGLGYWVGFHEGAFVGQWILRPVMDAAGAVVPGEAELGYRLLRRWWRRGLATEGARELLRHGFQDIGLHRVVAQTMVVNEASRAVMSALGMTQVRLFREQFDDPVPGVEYGEVEYVITNGRSA